MSSQDLSLVNAGQEAQKTLSDANTATHTPHNSVVKNKLTRRFSPFWHNRLIEAGLILSMTLYYMIGNGHLGTGFLFQLNPFLSLPFLLIFAILCWYYLSFAIALLPLTLPFYLLQKTVFSHYAFSLAEISLGICLLVAVIQLLLKRSRWHYWLSWQELRELLGPFIFPILLFFLAAVLSIFVAYDPAIAKRGFREEVLDPLLYLLLALYCLRMRQHLARMLYALLGAGLLVALLGMAQYVFFKNTLILEPDGVRRIHSVYGSANSIGLFFDYILPIGLALVVAKTRSTLNLRSSWRDRIFALLICLPLICTLYLSQSLGAWFAIGLAALFIAALSIRNRRIVLVGTTLIFVVVGLAAFLFHTRIESIISDWHANARHISTTSKRIYLWLSALNMIHDSPWLGYGLNNWLCHYSLNDICKAPQLYHYLVNVDPVTRVYTGLKDEPNLSHPHNVFLHIWVSMGVFGVLAFGVILSLFFWLFARILRYLRSNETTNALALQWMTLGLGAAMLAAMTQGLVDSAFLEQDLAFCFWVLITALLLLRALSGTRWRGRLLRANSTL